MKMPVGPGDLLLDKYRVERVLGQGGMGIVVAARHVDLGELFAIKFLLPEALENLGAEDRFLREARASARLKGEHVAKVHDVGRLKTGAPYMVMEHLEGSDLKAVVRSRGPLPADEAARLVLQACEAIAEAHAAGIIHRDLKPANLFLIRRANGTPCLKVLDFGLSKHAAHDAVDLTKSGMIMGSPLYMPPEQVTRMKSADARSDVWALGVVLYELVTGKTLFNGETMMEVLARVLQAEPLPPSQVREGLPLELDAVVGRCLEKRPEARFQTVEELATALEPIGGVRLSLVSLAPASAPDRTQPLDRASRPHTTTLHVPQPDAMTVRLSQPYSAPPPPSHADAAPARASSVTGSAWGRTGWGGRTPLGAGRAGVVVALAVLACAAGGISGTWLARRSSLKSGQGGQVVDTAPAAAVGTASEPPMTALSGSSFSLGAPSGSPAISEDPVAVVGAMAPSADASSAGKHPAKKKGASSDPSRSAKAEDDVHANQPATSHAPTAAPARAPAQPTAAPVTASPAAAAKTAEPPKKDRSFF